MDFFVRCKCKFRRFTGGKSRAIPHKWVGAVLPLSFSLTYCCSLSKKGISSAMWNNTNSYLACVSKFARQHFRHLFLHFCVFKPRFTASKPSVFILELQENLLETAPVSFYTISKWECAKMRSEFFALANANETQRSSATLSGMSGRKRGKGASRWRRWIWK